MAAALLLCLSEDLNNTLTRVPPTHTHVCLLLNSSVMHDVMIFWAKDKNLLIRSLLFEMCVKLQTADFPQQDSRREECRATRAAWLSNSTSPSLSGIRRSVPSLLSLLCASAHLWRCALDLQNIHTSERPAKGTMMRPIDQASTTQCGKDHGKERGRELEESEQL